MWTPIRVVAANWLLLVPVSGAALAWRLLRGGRWVGFRPWPTVEYPLARWRGQCTGLLVTLRPGLLGTPTERHEARHARQQLALGAVHWLLYYGHWAWLSGTRWPRRHGYYDNLLERDARRAAGQVVEVPRSGRLVPRWGALGGGRSPS